MKKIFTLACITFLILSINTFSANYYIRSNVGAPWGSTSNETAMNTVYGAGLWTQGFYETINVAALLTPTNCFIFMEGGDNNATAFNNFLTANIVAIQNWVNAGGHLYLNAAPNVGGNINYGFGGTILNYGGGTTSSTPGNASVGQTGHPIFNGPYVPCGTAFTGNSFSHAYISGGSSISLITGTAGPSLTELVWGAGRVLFGGITTNNFHSPAPNAANLTANIISYMSVCCVSPTVTAVTTATNVCAGQTVTLTASGAFTYTWSPGAIVGTSVTVSPTVSTNYTVVGTSTTGCQASATVSTSVIPAPLVTSTPSVICAGQSATLAVLGTFTNIWNTGPATSSIVVSPTVTTTYSVAGTSTALCGYSVSKTLSVNPLPTITIAGTNTVCYGVGTNLTASGATTYSWNFGATSPNVFLLLTLNTTLTVTGTDANNCSKTATIGITVNPNPTVTAVSSNSMLCSGQSATLTAAGATSYTWNPGGTGTTIVVSPTITTTYTITGVNANNCNNTNTFTQNVTICGGLNELNISYNSLLVFPNPSNGNFNLSIENELSNGEFVMINAVGQKVYTQTVSKGNNTINALGIAKGFYHFVLLQNKEQIGKGKLVVE